MCARLSGGVGAAPADMFCVHTPYLTTAIVLNHYFAYSVARVSRMTVTLI